MVSFCTIATLQLLVAVSTASIFIGNKLRNVSGRRCSILG
jgi:hypothetical protein